MDQSLQPSLNTSAPHHASLRPGALKESVMRVVFCLAACACILAVALICVFLFANGLPFFAKESAPAISCWGKRGSLETIFTASCP